MQAKQGFLQDIFSFPASFWILNILQMLEKLAYWSVLVQMPVFIAQKDVPGGLHWDQTVKGVIFFCWALVQNIAPVFAGGYADRYGRKKTLFVSFAFIICGYLIIGLQRNYWPFLAGTVILGLGSGIFKPALQGAVAGCLEGKNSSLGWGIYFMLLNLAVFFGPPLSKCLKQVSWDMVFLGSAAIFAINILVLMLYRPNQTGSNANFSPLEIFRKIIRNLMDPRLAWFILLMSGFTIIYMQFYETLPNFIYDWADTSGLAGWLHLPDFMTMQTSRGTMISYEWLYNLNAGLIILGIVPLSWMVSGAKSINVIIIGTLLSALGLMLSGSAMLGSVTVAGILIYTTGEMSVNPRFAEHLGLLAPEGDKSLYLGYLNISFAFGLGGGSLAGGWMYHHYGEKAFLAAKYLNEHYGTKSVDLAQAMQKLQTASGLNDSDAAKLLWSTYHPYLLWLPFVLAGLISAAGLIIYRHRLLREKIVPPEKSGNRCLVQS